MYQEHMVTVSMRLTQQEDRMQLVNTEKEALAFIEAFKQKSATENSNPKTTAEPDKSESSSI